MQSIDKALRLVEVLSEYAEGLSVSELSKLLDFPNSTTHRYLVDLEKSDYIKQCPDTKRYKLSLKFLKISANIMQPLNLRKISETYLMSLMKKSSETVHISVMDKDHIVFVGKVESIQGIRSVAALGIRKEAYQTASGKAIIAYMPEQELESHISRINFRTHLPNTIKDREELLRDLQSVKQNGYAVDNEEYELGGICVASPIFDGSGRAIAAVSISSPTTRVSLEKAKNEFSIYVKETAVQLSLEMGYLNQEYFNELLDKAGW